MHAITQRLRFIVRLFSTTVDRFSEVEGYRLGASFAYYATFSIFPLMLLAVTLIGFVIGDDVPARERMLSAVAEPGSPIRDLLDKTLTSMQQSRSARGASALVSVFLLLFGASGAFVELDTCLNRIWCVPERKGKGVLGSIRVFLRDRLSGFAIVAGLGLTLLASLVTSSLLSAVAAHARDEFESAPTLVPAIARTAELAFSIALLSFVFCLAFHFIPRNRPPLGDVVGGAVLSTVALTVLKEVFASYLSNLTSYSAYGVVGGVLGLATWIYLSSQIILFGAQLTRVHAEMLGSLEECTAAAKAKAGVADPQASSRARAEPRTT